MYKVYCRIYQAVFKMAAWVLPWRKPQVITGVGSLSRLAQLIKDKGICNVMLVTGKHIAALGLADTLINDLKALGVICTVYSETVPNPTIDNIEAALKIYNANGCRGIIAFGGGSPMDCAKGIAARVARPNKSIPQMKGLLKIMRKTPLIFAVPTTAGTGSEATIAAVITNSKTHEKYAINDISIIPHYAVLDPSLTLNLPKHITAATGMDALTHAVEAYIGSANTKETIACAEKAVKLIFDNIYTAYSKGEDITARENMLNASYLAGVAFTRAYVGNVHAIAHTLGGFYNVPHGLANAVILPHVLDYYGAKVHKPLARLADIVGITSERDSVDIKANKFIMAIKEMNKSMDIPDKISGINTKDIDIMIARALSEANPLYPVPVIFDKNDMAKLYDEIREI
ncbi:MAG: iron-containing alcohol dehydrogenase [Oscillospiraceae bacterium]